MSRRVFVPKESFTATIDGHPATFREDLTRVREGHPILAKYGHLFREITVEYEWEEATAKKDAAR